MCGSSREVSTGMDFGSALRWREGVTAPGVAGGVKAGDSKLLGTPGVVGDSSLRSDQLFRYGAGDRGRGEITGEAWEGSSSGGRAMRGDLVDRCRPVY